jgi:hypothetical protein
MLRTIRTAIETDEFDGALNEDSPDAVRVTFSCGHQGGVWPEDARPGTPKHCLQCREVVTVVGQADVVDIAARRRRKVR